MINLLLEHCATHTTVKEIESCVKRYYLTLIGKFLENFWAVLLKNSPNRQWSTNRSTTGRVPVPLFFLEIISDIGKI